MLLKTETALQAKAYLNELLLDANEFLNVSEKMTVKQVSKTVELVLSEFQHINVADLKLCINMGISGKFGTIYNRIDGEVICGWFRTYQEQRLEQAETISIDTHEKLKNEWKQPISGEVGKLLKEALKDKINFDTPISEPVDMVDFRVRHENAMLEFKELHPDEQTPERRADILKKYKVL